MQFMTLKKNFLAFKGQGWFEAWTLDFFHLVFVWIYETYNNDKIKYFFPLNLGDVFYLTWII